MTRWRRCIATWTVAFLLIAGPLLPGCTLVDIDEIDDTEWFQRETRTALSSSEPSERSMQYLRRAALDDEWAQSPLELIEILHDRLLAERERVLAFHLAEFCYTQADSSSCSDEALRLYLSAVEYAYAYLFDEQLIPAADEFDPVFRWSCDYYNRSLARVVEHRMASRDPDQPKSVFEMNTCSGTLRLRRGESTLGWSPEEFETLLVTYNYDVTGLPGMSRTYGLGVPSIAVRRPWKEGEERSRESRFLFDAQQTYPATLFLRFEGSVVDARPDTGVREVEFELHDPMQASTTNVGDRTIPLECDLTTPLAYMLSLTGTSIFTGYNAMVDADAQGEFAGLFMLQPFREDRIPVVFVHGLMSSPLTWVPLLNDLLADPTLRQRYQFWFYRYPTGNPVLYSASAFRETLKEVVAEFDPEGTNRYLNHMLICGHSMGGLLTRTTVLDSGDRLWELLSDEPFDEAPMSPEVRELIEKTLFFERLPFVQRVVFMAVPHRGAERATSFIGWFGTRLITLPKFLRSKAAQLPDWFLRRFKKMSGEELNLTGIGSLARTNKVQRAIADWTYPEDLPVHSIIGKEGELELWKSSDGLVPYDSSHLDGVTSEKVVQSGHSVQTNAEAILELHRILALHLASLTRAP